MQRQIATLIDKYVGQRLRILRKQRDMSLEAVAEIIDVTQQQMSRYELGKQKLSADQLYQLARGFDMPVSWFFYGYQEDNQELQRLKTALHEDKSNYSSETSTEREQALVEAWRALPTQLQREKVLELLEVFGFKN